MRAYLVKYEKQDIYKEFPINVLCCDCTPKRKTRASYRCIECGDCMCRKHARKHFKPVTCIKEQPVESEKNRERSRANP